MTKPISFKDVNPDPPWEVEQQIKEQDLRHEARLMEAAGLPEDYLTQVAEVIKGRRFGKGSTAEGPDEVNL